MTPANEHVRRIFKYSLKLQRTGGSQGRVGEVLAAVVVHDDTDSQVCRGDDSLADVQRPVVEFRLPHLANDVEERGSPGVGDWMGRDRRLLGPSAR